MKKLPKQIFVTWDQQPNDKESFLLADESADGLADHNKRVVGTYQLVEEQAVQLVAHKEVLRKHR